MVIEAEYLDTTSELVLLTLEDGEKVELDTRSRPVNTYHQQFGKYKKKSQVKPFIKHYEDLGASVKFEDTVILKSDMSTQWNEVLKEVSEGLAVIEPPKVNIDAEVESKCIEEGVTAEAWIMALVKKEVDGDPDNWNRLVRKRKNIINLIKQKA